MSSSEPFASTYRTSTKTPDGWVSPMACLILNSLTAITTVAGAAEALPDPSPTPTSDQPWRHEDSHGTGESPKALRHSSPNLSTCCNESRRTTITTNEIITVNTTIIAA